MFTFTLGFAIVLAVCIIGLLMWAIFINPQRPNPLAAKIGEWMFVCALLVLLFFVIGIRHF